MQHENDPELDARVNIYLDARVRSMLREHEMTPTPADELDVQAAALALRTSWGPGTVWHDSAHRDDGESWWDCSALLAELDARAVEDIEVMREQRGRYRGVWRDTDSPEGAA